MRWAEEACRLTLDSLPARAWVLDVGAGPGEQAQLFRAAGHVVEEIDLRSDTEFLGHQAPPYDCVWMSHVLEHMPDTHAALLHAKALTKPGGILAITVPPRKDAIVGGHVSLWNAGLLLYRLVLAGLDCREAAVASYGYNCSVVVRRQDVRLPALAWDAGDINRLAHLFPLPVQEGFNGMIERLNWSPV